MLEPEFACQWPGSVMSIYRASTRWVPSQRFWGAVEANSTAGRLGRAGLGEDSPRKEQLCLSSYERILNFSPPGKKPYFISLHLIVRCTSTAGIENMKKQPMKLYVAINCKMFIGFTSQNMTANVQATCSLAVSLCRCSIYTCSRV